MSSVSPLMSALITHTVAKQKRKGKKGKKRTKEIKQVIESRNKGKEQYHLNETVPDPLGRGNGSTQPSKNKLSTTSKPPKKELTQELPQHICKLPLN
jgi:hypothetical protein